MLHPMTGELTAVGMDSSWSCLDGSQEWNKAGGVCLKLLYKLFCRRFIYEWSGWLVT